MKLSVARNPVLRGLAELRWKDLKRQVGEGSPKLRRAEYLFLDGAVEGFRWVDDGDTLEGLVLSQQKRYRPQFSTTPRGELVSACGCPSGRRQGVCEHLIVLAVTVRYLLTGESFGWFVLHRDEFDELRRQLLPEAASPRPEGALTVVLEPSLNGRQLHCRFESGDQRVEPFELGLELHALRIAESSWSAWERQRAIRELIEDQEIDASFVVELDEERIPLADRHLLPLLRETEVGVENEEVRIREYDRALLQPAEDWEALADGFYFSPSLRRIAFREESTGGFSEALMSRELPGTHGLAQALVFRQTDRLSFSEWNALTIPADLFDPSGEGFTLKDRSGEPATPARVSAQTLIEITEQGENCQARIVQSAEGMELPLPANLLRELERLIRSGTPVNTFQARKRATALFAYLSRIALAGTKAERSEHRKAFRREIGTPARRRTRGRIANPTQWLDAFEARWFSRSDQDFGLPLLVSESSPTWFVAPGAAAEAFRAVALAIHLLDAGIVVASDGEAYLETSRAALERALPALLAGASVLNAEVLMMGSPIEAIEPEVELKVSADDEEIDWFELRPEVRYQGKRLPTEQWLRMLSGAPIRMEDGSWRVLLPGKAEAIETLRRLFSAKGDAEHGGDLQQRIPRAQLFDWLNWREAGIHCDLPPEMAEVVDSLLAHDGLPHLPLPEGFRAELRPYQQRGYDWLGFLYRHRLGACLADDMGLGKTVQAIALLAAASTGELRQVGDRSRKRKPHLLVLPPTLLFNWQSEIKRFAPFLRVALYTGSGRSLEAVEADVVLTTYELARRDEEVLAETAFDIAVFDEAQHVKNLNASRAQAMRSIRANFRVCLTGTPLENRAEEYFAILDLAVPGLLGEVNDFRQRLREGDADPLLRRTRPFLLRRTKQKILPELPEKTETDLFFDLSDAQKACYTQAVAEVRKEVLEAYETRQVQRAGIMALAALTRLRQICISPQILDPEFAEPSPKIAHLLEQLPELADEGHAALIFSQFTRALDALESHLRKAGLPFVRIDGSTPQAQRGERIAAFQDPAGPPVFLISRKTGGAGLTLTRASYVFHLDPWWNPAVEDQATDRAHRIGQKQKVFVQRLLMHHTVEEKMLLLKERKRRLFDEILSGQSDRESSSLLTRDDFSFLLES